jgi:acid phosphatase type 7
MRRLLRVEAFLLVLGCVLLGSLPLCGAPVAPPARRMAPAVATVEWGPILGHVTTISMDVAWRTNQSIKSGVVCNGKSFGATNESTYHRLTVSGLEPGKTYDYRLFWFDRGRKRLGPEHSFTTVPRNATKFDFAAFGDTRSGMEDQRSVVEAIENIRPAIVLNSGDLVADGRKMSEWRTFFSVEASLLRTVPYYCVLGNHEQNSDVYYSSLALPPGGGEKGKEWYAFAYGNCFFVALDTNRAIDEQAAWLDMKLNIPAAQSATWRIVLMHAPPFSSGPHGGDANVLAKWVPLFEKYGVDLVFCGHDHIYERSVKAGVTYIITGGGGAPRYSIDGTKNKYSQKAVSATHFCRVHVDGNTLKVQAIKPDGTIIDVAMLNRQPRL